MMPPSRLRYWLSIVCSLYIGQLKLLRLMADVTPFTLEIFFLTISGPSPYS